MRRLHMATAIQLLTGRAQLNLKCNRAVKKIASIMSAALLVAGCSTYAADRYAISMAR